MRPAPSPRAASEWYPGFRPQRIVEVFRELDADLIALQEVVSRKESGREGDQTRYFAEELGYYSAKPMWRAPYAVPVPTENSISVGTDQKKDAEVIRIKAEDLEREVELTTRRAGRFDSSDLFRSRNRPMFHYAADRNSLILANLFHR